MLVIFHQKKLKKIIKFICITFLLAIILFYVLPKLISQLLFINPYENKIHFDNYQEPLRVERL